jgi:histidine decarboxylase
MNRILTLEDQDKLTELEIYLEDRSAHILGYPCSHYFDYTPLYKFLKYPINNIGDSFYSGGTFEVNTHLFERDVIDFFAQMLKAPENNYWGYITNGGSEGNLYGLYLAKRMYPLGIVYFSEDAHYSIEKYIDLLGLKPQKINSQKSGEIDYEDLEEKVKFNLGFPAILVANIGTTMKEAKDDIQQMKQILDKHNIKNHYIHCDAAFCGSYAQFLSPKPHFDFSEGADSITISGHKFIGSPIPCGIVIVLKHNKERVSNYINVIDSLDDTIMGSRNAITPLIMWYAIKTLGTSGLSNRLHECLDVADYAFEKLKIAKINAWRNPNALTILIISSVSKELRQKWQLAMHNGISHIIVKPGITKEIIDAFVLDVEKEFDFLKPEVSKPVVFTMVPDFEAQNQHKITRDNNK